MKPAVNTIVHAAHAAAADDGLREASVVNIEMKGGAVAGSGCVNIEMGGAGDEWGDTFLWTGVYAYIQMNLLPADSHWC